MSDLEAIAGLILSVIANAPGECDSAGRCYRWNLPPYYQRSYPPPRYQPQLIVPPYSRPEPYTAPSNAAPPKDPQEIKLKDKIVKFCTEHPEEDFCTELGVWFDRHPEVRR